MRSIFEALLKSDAQTGPITRLAASNDVEMSERKILARSLQYITASDSLHQCHCLLQGSPIKQAG